MLIELKSGITESAQDPKSVPSDIKKIIHRKVCIERRDKHAAIL